jgi:hypothetical protein
MFYALLYGRNISLPGEDLNFKRAGPLLGFRSSAQASQISCNYLVCKYGMGEICSTK